MNLDYDLNHLKKYVAENEIAWPQITDGRGWDMPLVEIYNVEGLPKSFLVDRAGIIRYKDLQGNKLESKVYQLLNEPEVDL